MRTLSWILAAAALASAPLAFAQAEAPPVAAEATTPELADPAETPAVAEGEAAAEPELICRTLRARTESRLRSRERVCRTQAQWDALDEQHQRGRDGSAGRNEN